ncbi:hypothetical protein CI610_02258 [invertebrate metagenome]|uniref:Uncharacterized protein n=1 Tax=invertebrate metagenome TaxID=1711999 RepID=A0A2H9T6H7_9ZZZZ
MLVSLKIKQIIKSARCLFYSKSTFLLLSLMFYSFFVNAMPKKNNIVSNPSAGFSLSMPKKQDLFWEEMERLSTVLERSNPIYIDMDCMRTFFNTLTHCKILMNDRRDQIDDPKMLEFREAFHGDASRQRNDIKKELFVFLSQHDRDKGVPITELADKVFSPDESRSSAIKRLIEWLQNLRQFYQDQEGQISLIDQRYVEKINGIFTQLERCVGSQCWDNVKDMHLHKELNECYLDDISEGLPTVCGWHDLININAMSSELSRAMKVWLVDDELSNLISEIRKGGEAMIKSFLVYIYGDLKERELECLDKNIVNNIKDKVDSKIDTVVVQFLDNPMSFDISSLVTIMSEALGPLISGRNNIKGNYSLVMLFRTIYKKKIVGEPSFHKKILTDIKDRLADLSRKLSDCKLQEELFLLTEICPTPNETSIGAWGLSGDQQGLKARNTVSLIPFNNMSADVRNNWIWYLHGRLEKTHITGIKTCLCRAPLTPVECSTISKVCDLSEKLCRYGRLDRLMYALEKVHPAAYTHSVNFFRDKGVGYP